MCEGLLVMLLGHSFPGAGSMTDLHPNCRINDRPHSSKHLDVVIFWRNTTLKAEAQEDEGLRHVLRSFQKYGLESRATKIHLVCQCDQTVGPPDFLRDYLATTPVGAPPRRHPPPPRCRCSLSSRGCPFLTTVRR